MAPTAVAAFFLAMTAAMVFPKMGEAIADAAKQVLVINTSTQALPVRDAENPAKQPFQKDIILNLNPGSDTGEDFCRYCSSRETARRRACFRNRIPPGWTKAAHVCAE